MSGVFDAAGGWLAPQSTVRSRRPATDERATITQRIRAAVAKEAGLTIDHVVFAAASGIPKTTSGKVQRGAVRDLYLNGELNQECCVTI